MAASKYRVLKFDGDGIYDWAVFHAADVKGMRSPIFYGQATPIVAGCGKSEANNYKGNFEKRDAERKAAANG